MPAADCTLRTDRYRRSIRVLILGGNGFIGSGVASLLARRGHAVTALARDIETAARRMPEPTWVRADIANLSAADHWRSLIAEMDAVVNCAGALQDGARDDVAAVQEVAMRALYEAARGSSVGLIVQISARTDGSATETPFLATKRAADAALTASGLPNVILRPAIVIDRNAHGGSALLRALAAFPIVTPLVHGEAPMQFASLDDVAEAVAGAIEGRIPAGSDLDIAAPGTLTLSEAVARHRRWLGLKPATVVAVPGSAARALAAAADLLGHLGWRSPLRSTAMAAAAGGITVSRSDGRVTLTFRSIDETLLAAPAGVQDLWFSRLYLLKPALFGALSLFWLFSGVIALLRFELSSNILVAAGVSSSAAASVTLLTSLADIVLGIGVIFRRTAALALRAMIGLSLAYLTAATILTPFLWTDPLGPLVKFVPAIMLVLVALAILDER